MHNAQRRLALSALLLACAPLASAHAEQILFFDDFETDRSANPRYDLYAVDSAVSSTPSPGIVGKDVRANFFYDYSTYSYHTQFDVLDPRTYGPILKSPGSATNATHAVRFDANDTTTGGAIINAFPKLTEYLGSQLPSGDVSLKFDLWMNYNGDFEGGGGSTEYMISGIHQQGAGLGGPVITAPAAVQSGYAFAIDGERGNGNDYRTYRANTRFSGTAPPLTRLDAGYVAVDEQRDVSGTLTTFPSDNGENTFYQGNDTSVHGLFPLSDGYETPGAVGKHWVSVEIAYVDNIVYYKINGALVAARTDFTASAGHALIGYGDILSPTSGSAALDNDSPAGANTVDANFALFDNVLLKTVDQSRPTWTGGNAGTWGDTSKWQNGVPDDALNKSATADFTSSATGPASITVDGNRTVRSITFNNTNAYTLSGGSITLDTQTTGVLAILKSSAGNHTINSPVTLNRGLLIDTAANSSIKLAGSFTVSPPPAGLFTSQAPVFTLTKQGAGSFESKAFKAFSLAVNGGSYKITPNGTRAGTSSVTALSVDTAAAARFDLTNNAIVVDYTGATSPLASLRSAIASAYNKGKWDLPGITSSVAAANPTAATSLAIALNSDLPAAQQFTDFLGQAADPTSVLIRYTWTGDANLDGLVDNNDLALMLPTGTTWSQGDFNYDGKVDPDDYALFQLGAAYGSANIMPTVPEPTSTIAFAICAVAPFLPRHRPGLKIH